MWLFCLSMAMPCMWPDLKGPVCTFLGSGVCAPASERLKISVTEKSKDNRRFIFVGINSSTALRRYDFFSEWKNFYIFAYW